MTLLTAVGILSAQSRESKVERVTIDQGLSQNFVNSLFQDKRGFLWAGTKDGLNRYDGHSFIVYHHKSSDATSLSENNVTSIVEDSSGFLWIGTTNGLNRFDPATEQFRRFFTAGRDSTNISGLSVNMLAIGKNNSLWISSVRQGVIRFNVHTEQFERFIEGVSETDTVRGDKMFSVTEDPKGKLWVLNHEPGIAQFDPATGSTVRFHHDPADTMSLINDDATKIFIDTLQNVWVGTRRYLEKLERRSGTFKHISLPMVGQGAWINGIGETPGKKFWITTPYHIFTFDPVSEQFSLLYGNGVIWIKSASVFDRSNILWKATGGSGILKCDLKLESFNSTLGQFLFSAYPEILAKAERGSKRYFKNSLSSYLNSHRAADFPSCIKDIDGTYWLATKENDLFFIRRNSSNLVKFPDERIEHLDKKNRFFRGLFIDREGVLWLSTSAELYRYDKLHNVFHREMLIQELSGRANKQRKPGTISLTCVAVDEKNNFWIGTNSYGLLYWDHSTQASRWFQHDPADSSSLSNDAVLTLLLDQTEPKRFLWIGTEGGGLNRFDMTTNTFTTWTENDGLPNDVVYGILPDAKNNLWMSTNKGISKFNPLTGMFRNYDASDGLQSNEFNRREYLKMPDGKMYFGGINGFNVFNPEEIRDNPTPPPMVLTDFKLFNRSVSFRDEHSPLKKPIGETNELVLDYAQNVISFEFAALDFSVPEKNQYEYTMEGFNHDWVRSGNVRTAYYTNLDPGKYIFRVRGSNNQGVWNMEGTSLTIVILPPYWQTWWFRLLAGITILLSVGGTLRYVEMRKIKERMQAMEQENAMERERTRISRDLHDELGMSLTRMSILTGLAERDILQPEKISQHVDDLSKTTRDVVNTMDEVIWAMNPKYDTMESLVSYICQYASEFLELSGLRCRLDIPEKVVDVPMRSDVRHNIYLVAREAINNIVKHAQATEVSIRVSFADNCFTLGIQDNGKGISLEAMSQFGNGLDNMKHRIEKAGGTFEVTSSSGGVNLKIQVKY